MSADKKFTTRHLLNSVWMLCNNFIAHYFHFSHCQKPNVPSSLQVRKTNVNKQRLFLALSKNFSTVSAGGSEVIAASPDRQFYDSADFTDLSASSLDNTRVLFQRYIHRIALQSLGCGSRGCKSGIKIPAKRQTSPEVAQLIASSEFAVIRLSRLSQHLLSSFTDQWPLTFVSLNRLCQTNER